MSAAARATLWLDGLGEWTWPGMTPAVELAPAPWVPVLPRRRAAPLARPTAPSRARPARPLRLARFAVLLVVAVAAFLAAGSLTRAGAPVAVAGPFAPFASTSAVASTDGTLLAARAEGAAAPLAALEPPLPALRVLSRDASGSEIASVTYPSAALGHSDRFLVYLPPGYSARSARRYPVIYLLHGDDQPASSFLRLGLRSAMDSLVRSHAIAPTIAVMLAGAGRTNNWRDTSGARYGGYVTEVQRLVDSILPTVRSRTARAIAGYSMGGFGAMRIALANLRTFSVTESWEGYFDGLSGLLAAQRSLLANLPLHVFVYGGTSDRIASPTEDRPWAAALRAAGADATAAVYAGDHSFTPLASHLSQMLTFAARRLVS